MNKYERLIELGGTHEEAIRIGLTPPRPVNERPSWDEWALGIAEAVAKRADCTRRQVGAVILDTDHRVVSTGYNGAPKGKYGCLSAGACPRGKLSYNEVPAGSSYEAGAGSCIAVHAEANAIIHGDWSAMQGGTIYVTDEPCDGCRKLILGAGLKHIVYPERAFGGYHREWAA